MPNEVPVHDSLGLELFRLAQRINHAVCHVPCHHALTHTRTCVCTRVRAGACMRTDACACTCTHSVSMASQIQWQSRPHLPWRMAAPCVAAMTPPRSHSYIAATITLQPQPMAAVTHCRRGCIATMTASHAGTAVSCDTVMVTSQH